MPVSLGQTNPSVVFYQKNDVLCITSMFSLYRQNLAVLDFLHSEPDAAFSDLKVTVIMMPLLNT